MPCEWFFRQDVETKNTHRIVEGKIFGRSYLEYRKIYVSGIDVREIFYEAETKDFVDKLVQFRNPETVLKTLSPDAEFDLASSGLQYFSRKLVPYIKYKK
jgi:hypothetical protein